MAKAPAGADTSDEEAHPSAPRVDFTDGVSRGLLADRRALLGERRAGRRACLGGSRADLGGDPFLRSEPQRLRRLRSILPSPIPLLIREARAYDAERLLPM